MALVIYAIANVLLNVEFAVVATNNETLLNSSAPQRIKVSDTADKETRENLFELIRDFDLLFIPNLSDLSNENVSKQLAQLSNLDLIFIFTDLTDKNISTQLVELSQHILTVAIVPDSTPNKENFQNLVDSLIAVDDDNIFLMYNVVRGISNLITEPQLIGLDFADIKELLSNSGRGYVTYAKATGETPIVTAMKSAINSVNNILHKSKCVLFGIFGSTENISMMDANEASIMMQESAHPDAEIVWGVSIDETNFNFAEVIIIASDLEQQQ